MMEEYYQTYSVQKFSKINAGLVLKLFLSLSAFCDARLASHLFRLSYFRGKWSKR